MLGCKFDLSMLRDNLLAQSQVWTLLSSLFMDSSNSEMIWCSQNKLESSANISAQLFGVLQFNWRGFNGTYTALLLALGIGVEVEATEAWGKFGEAGVYQAEYCNSQEVKLKRKRKRKEKLKKQDAFIHQEGVMYKSQAFHGGKVSKRQSFKREKKKNLSQKK